MIVLVALLLSGCGSTPYFELGLGYKVARDTYPNIGRNPIAIGEVGAEWTNGWSLSYRHQSHLRDGIPFNDRQEQFMGAFEVKKKWK